jgi:hypothetical protein
VLYFKFLGVICNSFFSGYPGGLLILLQNTWPPQGSPWWSGPDQATVGQGFNLQTAYLFSQANHSAPALSLPAPTGVRGPGRCVRREVGRAEGREGRASHPHTPRLKASFHENVTLLCSDKSSLGNAQQMTPNRLI